jgi:hypothetical protein
LPDIALGEYVTTRLTQLAGKSVKDYLRETFLSEAEREKFAGRERLERLNPPSVKAQQAGDLFERE